MTSEGREELVARLVALGLDEREAKLYLHLAFHGPCRASDAAARTRLKRTETYRALEVLSRRGFAMARLSKPVVYEAKSPDTVFGELLASHELRRVEIQRLHDEVAAAVAEAREKEGAASTAGKPAYKMMQGRRAILHECEAMARHAKESLLLASTMLGAGATLQSRAWQTIARRATEGLPTQLLVRGLDAFSPALGRLAELSHVHVRLFEPQRPIRFMIVDARQILFHLVNDPFSTDGREDVAIWTDAPDFIHAQTQLFHALWQDAREGPRALRVE